jgi:hypothetical protein
MTRTGVMLMRMAILAGPGSRVLDSVIVVEYRFQAHLELHRRRKGGRSLGFAPSRLIDFTDSDQSDTALPHRLIYLA